MSNKAREIIENLLDDNSFVEFGKQITARNTDFNYSEPKKESDGVITGHGLIDERLVFVFSQDAEVLGGSIGEMHAKKIADLYRMAIKIGAPVIGFINSNGVRLYESMDAIEAIGNLIRLASKASGVVPQVLGIVGNCGGCLNVLASMNDYVVMLEDAKLFINSPDTIEGNYKDKLDTSSAEYQFNNGNIDAIATEDSMPILIRNYIDVVPNNNVDSDIDDITEDDLNRGISYDGNGDIKALITEIADDNIFVETKAGITNVICGFIKLADQTIGVAANSETDGKSYLNLEGTNKLTDFVKYCDAFSIPILTITTIDGFEADYATEISMGNALSKLAFAFTEATVPKINLIVGDVIGSGYIFMNSKALGADMVYAYSDAKMAIMDENKAAKILCNEGDDVNELATTFGSTNTGIENGAKRGYIDRIIEPADTRKYLIDGFEILYSKNNYVDFKKHSGK